MRKFLVILWEMSFGSIASLISAVPLSSSKMIQMAREVLFVLKYALSFAVFVCVLSLVILTIIDVLSSVPTIGESDILSFSYPTFWVSGMIGFLIGWVIGWQRLKERNLYRIYRSVHRK